MLSFDIRSLESQAVQVEGALSADDPVWQEGDPIPAGPVRVHGRLSSAGGAGRFYFSGSLKGKLDAECRRCLTAVPVSVEEADDPDVYLLDPRARDLDLRPAIREHWLLSVPGYAECRPDCKGLCPTCGIDLNTGSCDCTPAAAESRWDALRAIRSDAE